MKKLNSLIVWCFSIVVFLLAVGCSNPAAMSDDESSESTGTESEIMADADASFASSGSCTLKASVSSSDVKLTWSYKSMSVKYVEVYRGTKSNKSDRKRIAKGLKKKSYTDKGLKKGTYYYWIKVKDTKGKIVNSNAAKAEVKKGGSNNNNNNNNNNNTSSGDITLSPGGDLQAAINKIAPGKTIWLKKGTYKISKTIIIKEGNNGSSSKRKSIKALSGTPVLDFSKQSYKSSNRGLIVAGNYWHIKGIKIQKAGDNGMLLAGHNNIIEKCDFYANRDTGLQISRFNTKYTKMSQWPSNNTIKNCYSHSNYDPDNGEDADGFAPKLTCGKGNKFIGCRAISNVDDGWDLYTKKATGKIGSVYFENCEASKNGKTESGQSTKNSDGNGFKLGGSKIAVSHTLVNCKAYNNKKHGFTWNSNPGKIVLKGCKASGNGGEDFKNVKNQ